MKKIITGFFILASLFLFKFASAEITIPTLSSLSATSTGSTTAILSAFISSSGGSTITEYGFCYSTTGASSRTCYKSSSVLSETRGGFSLNITGLVPNTSYAYYAYAKNSAGTGTIGEYIFKAPVVAGGTLPGVVISPASSITSSSVVFGGNVTYLGNPASIISRGVCYSSNSSYMPSYPGGSYGVVCVSDSGVSLGSYSISVTGLNPNTTYYYKAYAVNGTGVAYSGLSTFKTLANVVVSNSIPSIISSSVIKNSSSSTSLVMDVKSLGIPATVTSRGICYSTSSSYMPSYPGGYYSVNCIEDNSSNINLVNGFTINLATNPGATYYIKGYAKNSTGVAYTGLITFTIPENISSNSIPTIVASPAGSVSQTGATLLGYVSNLGYPSVITSYGFCYNTNSSSLGYYPNANGSSTYGGSKCVSFSDKIDSTESFRADITGLNPNTTYYYKAYAVNSTGTATSTNTQSFITETSVLTGGVDLVGFITNPSLPKTITKGTSLSFDGYIQNSGEVSVSSSSYVDYIIYIRNSNNTGVGSGTLYGTVTSGIKAGGSGSFYKNQSRVFDYTGTYNVSLCVDDGGVNPRISETNEQNNCKDVGVITVIDTSVSSTSSSVNLKPIMGYTTYGVKAGGSNGLRLAIINNGYEATKADTFYSYITVADQTKGAGNKVEIPLSYNKSVPVYKTNSDIVELIAQYTFDKAGTYSFAGCVDQKSSTDTSGLISESNEKDNCSPFMDVKILPNSSIYPDLSTGATAVPSGFTTPGTTLNFESLVFNNNLSKSTSGEFYNHFEIIDSTTGAIIKTLTPVKNSLSVGVTPIKLVGSYKFDNVGSYKVRTCADKKTYTDTGSIKEYNENNNCVGVSNPIVVSGTSSDKTTDSNTLLPDLISSMSPLVSVKAGTPVRLDAKVTNKGLVDIISQTGGHFEIKDSNGSITDIRSNYGSSGYIPKNSKSVVTDSIISYTFTTGGSYQIQFCADQIPTTHVGTIKESDEDNNCSGFINVVVADSSLPNLTVAFDNTTYIPGVQGTINATVTKTGNVASNTTFYNRMDISTKSNLIQAWFSDFKSYKLTTNTNNFSGDTMKVSFPWKFVEGYTGVRFCTDQGNHSNNDGLNKVNQIKESSETDNCTDWVKFTPVTSGGTSALPDLIIDGRIYTDNLYSVVKGVEFPLYATVKNKGGSTITSFKNHFEFKDTWLGSVTDSNPIIINGLTSGGTTEIKTFKKFSKAGTYYVRVCADQEKRSDDGEVNDVKESNEKNNCYKDNSYDWTYIVVRDNYTDPINTTNGAYYGPLNGKNNKPIVNLTAYLPEYSSSLVSGSKVSYPGYIYNEGSAVTTDFKTSFSVTDSSGKIIANFPEIAFTPTVPANSKTAKSAYNFTLPTTAGTYTVKFCVDTTDLVTESTNADNCTTRTFVIKGAVVGSSQLASCQAFKFTRNMSWGSTDLLDGDNEVEKLQKLLVWMKSKYPTDQWLSKISFTGADGSFGKLTEEGVDYFQSFNPTLYGISNSAAVSLSQQTGNTDTQTRAKLNYFWQLYCKDSDKSLTPSSGTWDLSVDSIILPEVVKINGGTPIIVRVRNNGTADIPPMSFNTNWRGDNNSDFITGTSLNTETVKARSTIDVLTYHSFGNTGKQKVKACADIAYTNYGQYGNNTAIDKELSYFVNETNENNNCTPEWKNFTVVLK